MNSVPSVSIVIPNWNGVELLKKHLPSVVKESKGREVIVVDDHSSDASVAYLHQYVPSVKIIEKAKHKGFASSVNSGVQEANGDVIILLNTDISPEKGYLEPLLIHFSDPRVFAVGCLDKSHENGKIVLRGRGIGWWEKGMYVHRRGEIDKTDTAWVSGGSGAFRKSMWMELGGMDDRFDPFYWEDIDLSCQAKEKGYSVLFEPKSVVNHFHEEGKIRQEFTGKEIEHIAFRNQFYFIWKHAPLSQLLVSIVWTPIRILQEASKGNWGMLCGFLFALPRLPQMLLGRR